MTIHSRKTLPTVLGVLGVFVALIIVGINFFGSGSTPARPASPVFSGLTATVYRSATCGCCGNYISYLRRSGINVEEKLTGDMPAIKKQFNVPDSLTSCHTTKIGDYTVEGHVPVEAIEKLLTEKPSVAGIGMGGMPSGSPGMPGAKYGLFDIESYTLAGKTSSFLSL